MQNQQQPLPFTFSKVGCFWANLEFDFFAYSFPAIYEVCGNTQRSFIKWVFCTFFTEIFQHVKEEEKEKEEMAKSLAEAADAESGKNGMSNFDIKQKR